MSVPLPLGWTGSRATALATTLLLHAALALWLLAVRAPTGVTRIVETPIAWIPTSSPPLPPPPTEPGPATLELTEPLLFPVPWLEPADEPAPATPDWQGSARAVARATGGGAGRRVFGPAPEESRQLKSKQLPPTVFERPLPRVGTTTTTPEGETVLWVSDNCYIPLASTSLTMQDFHQARQGIRRCQIGVGKKEGRDDLFEHLQEQAPAQQEPGCGPDGRGGTCVP